jgi:DNA-directed RNA polymerase subunit RPC12/RpoP
MTPMISSSAGFRGLDDGHGRMTDLSTVTVYACFHCFWRRWMVWDELVAPRCPSCGHGLFIITSADTHLKNLIASLKRLTSAKVL